jgi:PAS domain S-box-containing protein
VPARPAPATEALISTGEAARRCGISRYALLRATRRGDLIPALRTSRGGMRFCPADIDTFAAQLVHVERSPRLAALALDSERIPSAAELVAVGEARFRVLVERSSDLVRVLAADTTLLYASPSHQHVLGFAPEELLARRSTLFIHPDDRQMAQDAFNAVVAQGGERHVLLRMRHAEGGYRTLEAILQKRLSDPAVRGIVVNSRDITEREAAATALRASEERYRQVEHHAPIGLTLVTPDGRWLSVNPALCALVGYSEAELLARTFQDIAHPADLESDLDYQRQLLEGEIATYQVEKRYIRKDGGQVWALLSVSLARDAEGRPAYFICQIQDISERKRAEAALDEARRLADRRAVAFAALQAVTAALATARTPAAIAQVVAEQGRAAIGAAAAVVRLLTADGAYLQLLAIQGFADEDFQSRAFLPVGAKHPASAAVRTGQPLWCRGQEEFQAHFPAGASSWHITSNLQGAAVLPLIVDGRTVGALGISFATPQSFDQADRDFLLTMASATAQALERARLDAAERERARAAEELATLRAAQAAQAEAMTTITTALSGTLEPEKLYALILEQAALLLPSDHATVLLFEDGWATAVATWGSPAPPVGARLFNVAGQYSPWLPPDGPGAVKIADTAAEPTWVDYPPYVGAQRIRSTLVAPLVIDGVRVGLLSLHSTVPGYYRSEQLPLASAFAVQVCLALRNARLYRAEQERRRAAEGLAQMRNDFLGAVSHELRTPLTSVIGYAELLRERWPALDEAHRKRYLERIVTSANRQQRLVQDLLETSRIEAGMLRCARATFHLRPLLERAAAEVCAVYRGQRIDLHGAKNTLVEGDMERTLQILINLVDNAAKYSAEGSAVTVTWSREDKFVSVRVCDSGSGIPEANRAALFTRFGRLPGSKARAGCNCTGLGLYLSHMLAEAMAGDLILEASGAGGSTFRLRLPVPAQVGEHSTPSGAAANPTSYIR